MMSHRIPRSTGIGSSGIAVVAAAFVLLGAGCRVTDGGVSGADAQTAVPAYTPSAEASRLTSDVRWLAADAREGRRAGQPGEAAAARWLGERLASLGLEPAGEGGWFQELEVPLPVVDRGGSAVRGHGQHGGEVAFQGADWVVPLFCSGSGEVRGPLLFAGYGIEREEMNWNDFEGLDLKGCVALLVRGTPPGPGKRPDAQAGDGEGEVTDASAEPAEEGAEPDWGSTGSIFHKVMEAKRRGAVGVILVDPPEQANEPLLPFEQARTAEAGIPAVMVSHKALKHLMLDFERRLTALRRWGTPFYDPPAPGDPVVVKADVQRAKGKARNVLGRLAGRDRSRTIVVGAHFDHIGLGDMGSRAPEDLGKIHNGADDNASGTAVVLEVARLLSRAGTPPPCDVVFALWSGEELGLLGSEHWTEAPTVPLGSVVCNVNLDMVGRAGEGALQVLGAGSAAPLAELVRARAEEVGLRPEINLSGQGMGGSDHQVFLKRKIPALHLFTGIHEDYHRPSDDAERFEADGAARVADLVVGLVQELGTASPASLAWVEPPADETEGQERSRRGFNTTLGGVPSYSWSGPGVRLDGTSPGSPAERAGLLPGDVLIGLGDVQIDTIHDYVFALQRYNPGNVVQARFLRDGTEHSVTVTLLGRALE